MKEVQWSALHRKQIYESSIDSKMNITTTSQQIRPIKSKVVVVGNAACLSKRLNLSPTYFHLPIIRKTMNLTGVQSLKALNTILCYTVK